MLRLNRDPVFWRAVADHPAVAKVKMGLPLDIEAIVAHERVTPLASENGGFLFLELDGFGRVVELHTLYRPEGWGREVLFAAKEAFSRIFETAMICTTYETGDRQSRPPLSMGWRSVGGFKDSPIGPLRTWILTKDAWEASPSWRRKCRLP